MSPRLRLLPRLIVRPLSARLTGPSLTSAGSSA